MSSDARQAILSSIRSHLAASVPEENHENLPQNPLIPSKTPSDISLVDLFRQSVEAVNGHGIIVNNDSDIAAALTRIITGLKAQRLAVSDNSEVERLLNLTDLEIEELGVAPDAHDIFRFDVGITTAQAAIAETGTLVLDSTQERHRLVSLVPPVHIAIIDASKIYETLGEVLAFIHKNDISPAVTFITGPSRTADIELTLTVGVHGPQELHVIINGST